MQIGFIGLGHMGLPMACNLQRAGYNVVGFDLEEKACALFRKAGGTCAATLTDACRGQDAVITMLQTGEQVRSVCQQEGGIFSELQPGTVHIDCSTIDIASAQFVHREAQKHGIAAIDAPVSGGVTGAKAANLTFMAGGDELVFKRVLPILGVMGKQIIHTGASGNGQAAKLCNNMMLGISMLAASEAFILAKELGLSAQKLHEVVTKSSGNSWVMERYVPVPDVLDDVPANHHYEAGFSAAMMFKDLKLSQDEAKANQLQLSMAKLATALFQAFIDSGNGKLDFSAIVNEIS